MVVSVRMRRAVSRLWCRTFRDSFSANTYFSLKIGTKVRTYACVVLLWLLWSLVTCTCTMCLACVDLVIFGAFCCVFGSSLVHQEFHYLSPRMSLSISLKYFMSDFSRYSLFFSSMHDEISVWRRLLSARCSRISLLYIYRYR